jgi:uncharacterized sulfatase
MSRLITLALLLSCLAATKPNLIVIVTDDQARWSVGAYGNKDSITPNMDRLAREGAQFMNAFVNTPVCSSSRASFLTGLNGTELGITDWININEGNAGVGLPADATTWPQLLQQNGYTTALVGKWHLGHLPQFHPTKHGYSHFYGFLGGGESPMDPMLEVNGQKQRVKGPISDLFTTEAIRWIDENKSKPFALSLHFREPHLPYGPVPEEDSSPFKNLDPQIPNLKNLEPVESTKDLYRAYYAAIHAVDRNLGRLLAKLDELKLADNTIILFTSDHGYNIGHHNIHAKGNGRYWAGGQHGPIRPNMFEQSIRVPLLVRYPAVVKAGTKIEPMVMNLDTFASLLALLNIPIPQDSKQHGRDFSPLLRGEPEPADWRHEVFAQYDLHNNSLAYMRMVRTNDWKLVRHYVSNAQNELYDLKNDPGEKKNLFYDKSAFDARGKLQEQLNAWEKSINDPILQLDNRPLEPGPPVGQ